MSHFGIICRLSPEYPSYFCRTSCCYSCFMSQFNFILWNLPPPPLAPEESWAPRQHLCSRCLIISTVFIAVFVIVTFPIYYSPLWKQGLSFSCPWISTVPGGSRWQLYGGRSEETPNKKVRVRPVPRYTFYVRFLLEEVHCYLPCLGQARSSVLTLIVFLSDIKSKLMSLLIWAKFQKK